ncbi:hypothetical protein MZM54_01050 [[Brevibacterium] frigoritolerans]|nr:hypothetical protein [Peribacillus frigoritolerans]
MNKCRCNKEYEEIYQVKLIDPTGKLTYEKVCSVKCAEEIQEDLYHLHQNRADDMKNQVFQKLK